MSQICETIIQTGFVTWINWYNAKVWLKEWFTSGSDMQIYESTREVDQICEDSIIQTGFYDLDERKR